MRRIAVAALAVLGLAGSVQAEDVPGWRETRWGMTEDEVLAAMKGEANRVPTPRERAGRVEALEIPQYAIGPYRFKVTFNFTEGKLVGVILTGDKDSPVSYPGVKDMVVAKYGAPASESPTAIGRHAQWNFPSTRIALAEIRAPGLTIISLSYSPPAKDLDKL